MRPSAFQLCSNSLVDLRLISKAMPGPSDAMKHGPMDLEHLLSALRASRYANKTEEWMCTLGTWSSCGFRC